METRASHYKPVQTILFRGWDEPEAAFGAFRHGFDSGFENGEEQERQRPHLPSPRHAQATLWGQCATGKCQLPSSLTQTANPTQQLPFHTGEPQNHRLVWVGKTLNLIPFHPCRGLGHLPQPGMLQTRPGRDTVSESEAESAWKSLYCRNSRWDNCQHVCPAHPCPPGDAWPLSGKEPPALISSELLPRLQDPSLLCN